MESLKICFAGNSGHSGSVFAAYDTLQAISVLGYCSTYPGEQTEDLEQHFVRHGLQVQRYEAYREMLDYVKPDIFVVDGQFCDHGDMAMYALARGIHVYADKPAATELDQLIKLSAAIRSSTGKYAAMHTTRYLPAFYTAKKRIEAGAVGTIRMINGQKSYKLGTRADFYKHRKTFGGIIPWVSIHGIDMALWITGAKVQQVYSAQSIGENFGHGDLEMVASSLFELDNGVIFDIHADYLRPQSAGTHGDDRIRVVGDAGILEVRGGQVYLENETQHGKVPLMQPDRTLFADFVHWIRTGDPMLVSPEEAVYAAYCGLMARESAEQGIPIRREEFAI